MSNVGQARKIAKLNSQGDQWPGSGAQDAGGRSMHAFETVANDFFAETNPFQVNTITQGSQDRPATAALASGGFVAAWETSQSIKLQVYDRHGEKIGSELLVSTVGASDPAVIGLPGGGFVVAYSAFVNSETDIWGRMYDAAGSPVAGQFLMSTESFGNGSQPSLAALSSGGFVATWTAQDIQFSSTGVKGQIFDASGARVGGEFNVNPPANMEQYYSLVGALPGGGFVATWIDQINGFRGQIFDGTGAKLGAEFAVDGSTSGFNALTVLSSGNFVVAAGVGGGIFGQIYSPAGARVGGAFQIHTAAANIHDMPSLAALPDGGFVATWRDATGTTPNFFQDGEIKAQLFDSNGVKVGGEFMVNVGTTGGQMLPQAVAFGSGDFTILWQDYPSSQSEIMARRYFSATTGTASADSYTGTGDRDFYRGLDGDDEMAGSAGDDDLSGGGGNDRLIGGAGADSLDGGAGADRFVYSSFSDSTGSAIDRIRSFESGVDKIDLYAAGATSVSWEDKVDAGTGEPYKLVTAITPNGTMTIRVDGALQMSDFVLAPPGGPPIAGTSNDDVLPGTAASETISGLAGNDVLGGEGGDDRLEGGTGNDVFHVNSAGDLAIENEGEGADIVYANTSYELAAGSEIEILSADSLGGTAALTLVGNDLVQLIYGNTGANLITGGGGADRLVGFGGDDTYIITDGAEAVFEGTGEGTDIVYTHISHALAGGQEIELLSAASNSATTAMDLTGNELANTIYGNNGVNNLRGGGGSGDKLIGFGGNDVYFIVSGTEQLFEAAGGGSDVVYTNVSHALVAGQEIEILSAISNSATDAMDLTGNELTNVLYGNNGVNNLRGGGGSGDALIGFGGNDVYYIVSGSEQVIEATGGGSDIVYTNVSHALAAGQEIEALSAVSNSATDAIDLAGNERSNTIYGNNGANFINGGAGSDTLFGYGGADSFAFTTALGGGNVDHIVDFSTGADKILLDDAAFAGLGLGALAAGAFVNGLQAQDADDRILYDQTTGLLLFDVDGNGAAAAVLFATLVGGGGLAASDFTVI